MKSFFTIRQEWWRTVVFLLWIIALVFLLLHQRYTIFLRSEFGILLGLGIVTLACFLLSGSLVAKSRPLGMLEMARGCILILPLAYMLNSGEQGLDSNAFQNRSLGLPSVAMNTPTAVSPGTVEAPGLEQSTTRRADVDTGAEEKVLSAPAAPQEEVSMLDIYMDPQKYKGRIISVIGIFTKNRKVQKDFGEKAMVVFRFTINCCAADAIPLALIILESDQSEFPDNTWVRVRGVFDLEKKEKDHIPVLKQASVEETKTPEIPYIF